MKYVFILNSFCNRELVDLFLRIEAVSKILELDYVIEINSDKKSTEDIIKKYSDTKNIIVAIGGDGMINKVLNTIVNTDNYLSYIPYGTGNDFDKTVRETLSDGENNIDLVKINDKYFINTACFGIDADIANDDTFVHNEKIPRSLRYDIGAVYHFMKYKPKHMEVIVDNKTFENDYSSVIICNGKYYGGGYRIGPTSVLNDHNFELYLIDKMNRLKMAKTMLGAKTGKHEESSHVKKIITDSLVINSDVLLTGNIDGEKIEAKTFKIELIPNGVKLFNNQDLIQKILIR